MNQQMDELASVKAVGSEETAISDWLLPSVALDRFEPPEGMVLSDTVEKEAGRYGFRVGSLGLLMQLGVGSEVMELPAIWTLPGAPPWLLGLINLRGNLVPVFELRILLGMEPRVADQKPLVLVFDQGEKAVGILIEDFPVPLSALHALPNLPQLPTALSGHVRTGYVKDSSIWLEFDHSSFFEEINRQVTQ
ncbi:MAG TPA: chemotaxis protein CheW [Gallionellaceae bacterium]|nr:chemotaxis protein CheW [Gallionellaceae bacterium]HQS75202.1 chemotaxis protein CheW [Gallionellaceae bacterium]